MSTPLSEGRLRQIVEQAPDLIYYCDAEGRFTYLNSAARLILKYEPDELIAEPAVVSQATAWLQGGT